MKAPTSRTGKSLLYLGGWSPIFILYVVGMRETGASDYPHALLYTCTYLFPGILTGAAQWALTRRIRWSKFRLGTFVAVQTCFIAGHLAAWDLLFLGLLSSLIGYSKAMETARHIPGWGMLFNFLICGLQAAVFQALRILAELKKKAQDSAEANRLRARAEMEALRGQLNPHFLFNSLHSITALVRDDPVRAEEALLQFSALLRRVLDIKREEVDEAPLSEEIAFVDDYLAIERLRLGERLKIEKVITLDALGCWIPTFSVQPLVENALRHAVAPRRDGGNVSIRASIVDKKLVIVVRDDGPGADPAAVACSTGVGLGVVRQRLALRHGPAGESTIITSPGQGFEVRLAMPAISRPVLDHTS